MRNNAVRDEHGTERTGVAALPPAAGVPIPEQNPEQMPTLRARRAVLAEIAAVQGETVPQQ